MANQADFTSKYFQLEQVAEGVYAAIVVKGTGAMGNAAIVDLGDRTLVFDTFFTPQAAVDLRRAAEQLFLRPVTLVVNSHWHNDHVRGNQVFPEATILSTAITREMFQLHGPRFIEMAKQYPDYPKQMEKEAMLEQDETKRRQMLLYVGDLLAFAEDVPTIELRFPDLTFERELVLHGSKRSVRLLSYGGGHTQSDAFLYLPEEQVAIMGDLLSVQNHNQFRDGDAAEWVRILQEVEKLPIAKAIPGHGPVGTMADIVTMRQYFEQLLEKVDEMVEQGITLEAAVATPIPARYQEWEVPELYARNIKQLMELRNAKVTV